MLKEQEIKHLIELILKEGLKLKFQVLVILTEKILKYSKKVIIINPLIFIILLVLP